MPNLEHWGIPIRFTQELYFVESFFLTEQGFPTLLHNLPSNYKVLEFSGTYKISERLWSLQGL